MEQLAERGGEMGETAVYTASRALGEALWVWHRRETKLAVNRRSTCRAGEDEKGLGLAALVSLSKTITVDASSRRRKNQRQTQTHYQAEKGWKEGGSTEEDPESASRHRS